MAKARKIRSVLLAIIPILSIYLFFPGKKVDYLKSTEKELINKRAESKLSKKEKKKRNIAKLIEYEKFIRGEIVKDRDGNIVDNSHIKQYESFYKIKEYEKALRNSPNHISRSKSAASGWVERGPAYGYTNKSNTVKAKFTGRAIAFAVDENNKNTWYLTTAGGGVYKTSNAGDKWIALTEKLPNLSASSVALSKSNSNIVYIATGDALPDIPRGGITKGDGIFRSSDGGTNWTGLAASRTKDFEYITRIIVDPANANYLVVTTSTGIFYSDNGGTSFTKASGIEAGKYNYIVRNKKNFKTQYAALQGKGIYKSTDAGKSWKKVWSYTEIARYTLATTQADTSVIIGIGHIPKGDNGAIFKSTDAGKSWNILKQTNSTKYNIFTTNGEGGPSQGFYDQSLAISPYDASKFYIGGIDIYIATSNKADEVELKLASYGYPQDAGKGRDYIHVDQHGMETIDRGNGKYDILFANDGGVAVSTDDTKTYVQKTNGLHTIQFYYVTRHPDKNAYFGGTQDNGSNLSTENPDQNSPWTEQLGGDGFGVVWHYQDANKVIASIYNAAIYLSTDGTKNFVPMQNFPGFDRGEFITRIAYSNAAPNMISIASANRVFTSHDFGQNWINAIPGRTDHLIGDNFHLSISDIKPNIIYAGDQFQTGKYGVMVSKDGGFSFEHINTAPKSFDGQVPVSGLATDPKDEKTAYYLFSYSGKPHVLRTKDMGKTWEDLSGQGSNFPDVRTYCLQVMPHNRNELWAGTEIGLFISTDNGKTWAINKSIPAVSVRDIRIVKDEAILATHGRGAFTKKITPYLPTEFKFNPSFGLELHAKLNSILFNLNVLSLVDSIQVLKTLGSSTETQTFKNLKIGTKTLTYNYSKAEDYSFKIKAYDKGKVYESPVKSIKTVVRNITFLTSYSTTFDSDSDFELNGFTVSKIDGFNNPAAHTEHPYKLNKEYTLQLKNPVKIKQHKNFLSFSEVVLVNDYIGSRQFDHVIVEASFDLKKWLPLTKKYDALEHKEWKDAKTGSSQLFKTRTISLPKDTFKLSDAIFLRFRLNSDEEVVGWGWAIDNLSIQGANIGYERASLNYAFTQNPSFPKNAYFFLNSDKELSSVNVKYKRDGSSEVNDIAFDAFINNKKSFYNKNFTVENSSKTQFYFETKQLVNGQESKILEKDTVVVSSYQPSKEKISLDKTDILLSKNTRNKAMIISEYKLDKINDEKVEKVFSIGYDKTEANEAFELKFYINPSKLDYSKIKFLKNGKWIDIPAKKFSGGLSVKEKNYGNYALVISKDKSEHASLVPAKYSLSQNYPNPFNPTTTIAFKLPVKSTVQLIIYNSLGQKVRQLVNSSLAAGRHEYSWNAKNDFGKKVSSGIYFYKLLTENQVFTKKMVLLK